MTDYARQERRWLADLLDGTGPDEPTLCAGWTTRDLAAHLVVRDRRPDASAGLVIPPLAGHGEHVRKQKAALPYPQLVDEVRNPPWWSPISNPLTHELANTFEYFVHHEDVRRGSPGWTPRELDKGEEAALWRAVRFTARLALRRAGVPVTVRADGFGEVTVGNGPAAVTISGTPGELAMFVSGRQQASVVEIDAPAELEAKVRGSRFAL